MAGIPQTEPDPTVSLAELRARLADPALAIVDVRCLAAYNGWRLPGEARGGHIPGAIALPAPWAEGDGSEMRRLLHDSGITPEREIVLYGDRALAVRDRLAELGWARPRIYAGGWPEWSADRTLPLERLANRHALAPVRWLRQVLAGELPEAAPTGAMLLFHVGHGVRAEHERSHIPTALPLDTDLLEDPRDWNRRAPLQLEAALRSLGITRDATVVLYGRDGDERTGCAPRPRHGAGQIAAARAALILRYCGVDDVRLLDGGYGAWVREAGPLESGPRAPRPVAATGLRIPERPQLILDIEDVRRLLADPEGAVLVSVRSRREQTGEVSGYDSIGPTGRIAGDVWGGGGSDAHHMQDYRNADGTMRPYTEVAAAWARAGISADKRVAFYCGTGWRASEAWFHAHLMGWPRIGVYDGGWLEWSRDPARNPIAVGEPVA